MQLSTYIYKQIYVKTQPRELWKLIVLRPVLNKSHRQVLCQSTPKRMRSNFTWFFFINTRVFSYICTNNHLYNVHHCIFMKSNLPSNLKSIFVFLYILCILFIQIRYIRIIGLQSVCFSLLIHHGQPLLDWLPTIK